MRISAWPFRFSGGFVLSYRWWLGLVSDVTLGCGLAPSDLRFALELVPGVMFGSCFASPYRWLDVGVGFGRAAFAVVSPYPIIGSR